MIRMLFAGALALAAFVWLFGPVAVVYALLLSLLFYGVVHYVGRVPRQPWMPAIVLLAVIVFVAPAFAQNTAIDVGGIFGAWRPMFVDIVGILVTAALGAAAVLIKKKFGLDFDAKHRETLQTTVTNAAGLALDRLGNSLDGKSIDAKNAAVAAAVNYVGKGAPDALKHFGLVGQDSKLREMITAKLPQVANTTTKA